LNDTQGTKFLSFDQTATNITNLSLNVRNNTPISVNKSVDHSPTNVVNENNSKRSKEKTEIIENKYTKETE